MFESRALALFAMTIGAAGMAWYYLWEPAVDPTGNAVGSFAHIFWEAIAIRAFWPCLAIFILGACGLLSITIKRLAFIKS